MCSPMLKIKEKKSLCKLNWKEIPHLNDNFTKKKKKKAY